MKLKNLLCLFPIVTAPLSIVSCSTEKVNNGSALIYNAKGIYDLKKLIVNIEGKGLDKIASLHLQTTDGKNIPFTNCQISNYKMSNDIFRVATFDLFNEINEHSKILIYVNDDLSTKKEISISPQQNLSNEILESQTTEINSVKFMETKALEYVDRAPNKLTYDTELLQTYGDIGFRYPSWDFNYEVGKNNILKIPGTSTELNLQAELLEERVTFTDDNGNTMKATYNDPTFILNQIKNNTLKQHPAAKTWYQSSVADSTKSLTKSFSIDTTANNDIQLGLYAPAGEVITIQFTPETIELFKKNNSYSPSFHINSGMWDCKEISDSGRISNRYPFLRSKFDISNEILNNSIQIGSPFGGSISFNINNFNFPPGKIEFKVFGAVEQLHYEDGQTSKEEWKEQIDRLYSGEITAPAVSANADLFSLAIHFRLKNTAGSVPIKNFNYPDQVFKEFNQIFYIGNFVNKSYNRVRIEVSDDIWRYANALGGGNAIYAPNDMVVNTLFSNFNNSLDAKNDWTMLHEANHNFQFNDAIFRNPGHGKTIQLSAASMSMISNGTRWRSAHYRYDSEYYRYHWDFLTNPYWNIEYSLATTYDDAYAHIADSMILYLFGPKKYFEYIHQDLASNTSPNGGFDEIIDLSKFINYNLWPAFRMFADIWNDGWPSDDNGLTTDQKNKLKIIEHLPQIDFVGNIYASGSYNHNQEEWIYSEDYSALYQIPYGDKEVLFDFDNGINSRNINFDWDEIKFETTSKAGGKLRQDPRNKKNLIYTPPVGVKKGDLDEFEIAIIPKFDGMPSNYVPAYRWKIKTRQTFETTIFRTYSSSNNNLSLDDEAKVLNNKLTETFSFYRNDKGSFEVPEAKDKILRFSFKFITPETGKYAISAKWIDQFLIYVNDKKIFNNENSSDDWKYVIDGIFLKKGQVISIDAYSKVKKISSYNEAELGVKVHRNLSTGYESIDLTFNSTLINVVDPIADLSNKEFKYKNRQFDPTLYSSIGADKNAFNQYKKYIEEPKMMDLTDVKLSTTSKNPTIINRLDRLKDLNLDKPKNKFFEFEYYKGSDPETTAAVDIKFTFPQPTLIRAIEVFSRTDQYPNYRGNEMVIEGEIIENGIAKSIILYDGEYKTRKAPSSYYLIADPNDLNRKFSSITLNIVNNNIENDDIFGLSINTIGLYSDVYSKSASIISAANPNIDLFGQWDLIKSNPLINVSNINNVALISRRENEYLEFDMTGNDLVIIGKKGINNSSFDVYIDGAKVGSDVSTFSSETKFNQKLFSHYIYGENKTHKIKIVNKSNKELIIDNFIIGKSWI